MPKYRYWVLVFYVFVLFWVSGNLIAEHGDLHHAYEVIVGVVVVTGLSFLLGYLCGRGKSDGET